MKASIKSSKLPGVPNMTRPTYRKPKIDLTDCKPVILKSVYTPREDPKPTARKKKPQKPNVQKAVMPKVKKSTGKSRWWTDDRIKRLIELHKQGLTYADIAESMGTTKGAVTSKISILISRGLITPRNND